VIRGTLVLVWRDSTRTEERVRVEGDVTLGNGTVTFRPVSDDPNHWSWRVVPLSGLWEYRIER